MYKKVKKIEFELTTTCNAWCLGCTRYDVTDQGLMKSPYVEFDKQVDLVVIDNIISQNILAEDAELMFCGTAGDPLAHTKFLEIITLIKDKRPDTWLHIHTNGGLKHPEYYKKIAQLTNSRDWFKFNVDGLSDTNEIYRRNVSWDKIIENMKAFNENKNCTSEWQFIIFPWNEHQVEEARELSIKLGFDKFQPREARVYGDTLKGQKEAADKGLINEVAKNLPLYNLNESQPKYGFKDICFSVEGIFVNQNGIVHPCCAWADSAYREGNVQDQIKEFYGQSDWNNLNKYKLREIMENKFWKELYNSLYSNGKKPCHECVKRCGIEDEKPHWDNLVKTDNLDEQDNFW